MTADSVDRWVLDVEQFGWSDQWINIGPSQTIRNVDNQVVIERECDVCLVYNDHIPETAYWLFGSDSKVDTRFMRLILGGVQSSDQKLTPSKASAQLCRGEFPSLGTRETVCDRALEGCVEIDPITRLKRIRLQTPGWPTLECSVTGMIESAGTFISSTAKCTATNCMRMELIEQDYKSFNGYIQTQNMPGQEPNEIGEAWIRRGGTLRAAGYPSWPQ